MCLDASSTVFLALFVIWLATGYLRAGRMARKPGKARAWGQLLLVSLALALGGVSVGAMAQEATPESAAEETAASDTAAKADEATPAEPSPAKEPAKEPAEEPAVAAEEPDPTVGDGGPAPSDAEPTEEATDDGADGAIAGEPADEEEKGWRQNGKIMIAVAVAVIIIPFLLGSLLASRWRVREYQGKMTVIFLTIFAGVAITVMGWPPKFGIDLRGGVILVYELADEPQAGKGAVAEGGQDPDQVGEEGQREDVDMDNLIAAIKRRVNPGGVKEIDVREIGVGQVEITVPEVDETEVARLKRIISDIGTLEFRILANERDHLPQIDLAEQPENANRIKIYDGDKNLVAWWVPVTKGQEDKFGRYSERAKRLGKTEDGYQFTEVLLVNDSWNVNGGYLVGAKTGMDDTGGTCVNFHFNNTGGRLFGGLTGDNTPDKADGFKRALGIVLSGHLFSAPTIDSTIHERGMISGDFTQQAANDLVSVLNAGSLPTALNTKPASELATGPTLGKDTIERGQTAIAASMFLVLLFMVFYYRFAGVVACLAVIANLVLILAIMITVNAAFTLPGLAGLVLTVGMAVDANVLIFERIREELDRQATLRMAIRNGFKRATTTIVDANLTTLITGIVLYWIGTDQVKGFAVTLILGVTLSMYTAIFCSRVIFDIAEKNRWITRLTMLRIVGGTKIDFLGKRRIAAVVSIAIICLGLAAVVHRGRGLLDIDFTGGVSIQTKFNEPQEISEIREKLSDLDDLAVSDVQISNEPANIRFVINTSSPPDIDAEHHLENVKRMVSEEYGPKLEHYTMDWEVEGDVAVEPDESQPPAIEGEPQTRSDLPSDNLLASADPSAVMLARAEPPQAETSEEADGESKPAEPAAKEPATTKAEATADKPIAGPAAPVLGPAKPTTPEPEKPAAAEGAAPSLEGPSVDSADEETRPAKAEVPSRGPAGSYETRAKIDFGSHKMSRNALTERLEKQMEKLETVGPFELSNEEYDKQRDADKAHPQWTLSIDLSVDETKTLLGTVSTELESHPYFPASNTIGGKVAGNMRVMAILALLTSLVFIVGYIWVRFQKVMFGLAAVVALVHDVLITLGVIALSAYVANALGFLGIVEFKIGLSVLAAFLTIIGYSLNDTIVVFDRIREVRGKSPQLTENMINLSINQTLSRTLLTSLTTLIVVVILYTWGGQGIHAFAFSLVIGVLVGTYSSIFVASPALLWMAKSASGPRKNGAS